MRKVIGYVTIGAVIASGFLLPMMWRQQTDYLRDVGLERDAREAGQDTTRRLVLALNVLADGTQALQRRAVQAELKADKLDAALKLSSAARAGLTGEIENFKGLAIAAKNVMETESGTTIHARWAFRQAPYTISLGVSVKHPPAASILDSLNIALDRVPMALRVGCGPPKRENNGIRPASLTVMVPNWFRVSIDSVDVAPGTCNPKEARGWWKDPKTWTLAAALLGLIVAR